MQFTTAATGKDIALGGHMSCNMLKQYLNRREPELNGVTIRDIMKEAYIKPHDEADLLKFMAGNYLDEN